MVDGSLVAVLNPHFDLPFRRAGTSFAVVSQDTPEDVSNCVEAIIRTPFGIRNDSPEFGLDDHTFDNQPINIDAIRNQIETQEPRASLTITQSIDIVDELIDRLIVTVD